MTAGKPKYTQAPDGVGEAIEQGPEVDWREIEKFVEAPTAAELAAGLRTQKISLAVTEYSIERFKEAAAKEGVPYQQLIRGVLQWYAQHRLELGAA